MNRAQALPRPFAIFAAFAMAVAIAFAGIAATSAPAQAGDTEYWIETTAKGFNGNAAFYGKPKETVNLVIKPTAYVGYYVDGDWKEEQLRSATIKWSFPKTLKATVSGNNLVIKKLPKAAKTYKVQVAAYHKSGERVATKTINIVVKKKPKVKIVTKANNGKGYKTAGTIKRGQRMMLQMTGADWGWNNNTRKAFYVWKVKNKKTGKTVTWTSNKYNVSSNLIAGGSVAGSNYPVFMGYFKQAGKYKITATVYHSNKKIASKSKTITVK